MACVGIDGVCMHNWGTDCLITMVEVDLSILSDQHLLCESLIHSTLYSALEI